jgi:type II secretory pathway component PulF
MEFHNLSSILVKALLSGFWEVFKRFWWLFIVAIIIGILRERIERKIDNWKKRRNK